MPRSRRKLLWQLYPSYLLILFLCQPFVRRAWRPDFGSEAYALALGSRGIDMLQRSKAALQGH